MSKLFSERAELLATIDPASYTTEQNTGYVSLANFHRAVVIIHPGVLGSGLDVDIEEATTTAGAGAQSMDGGGKDVDIDAAAAPSPSIIEIQTPELDVADGYDCINVEVTPGDEQSGDIFGVQVWGIDPRYEPVATTLLDSVTD